MYFKYFSTAIETKSQEPCIKLPSSFKPSHNILLTFIEKKTKKMWKLKMSVNSSKQVQIF